MFRETILQTGAILFATRPMLGQSYKVTNLFLDASAAAVNTDPNFGTGNAIEVYDSSFRPTKLAGSFTDPTLPTGYSLFSLHVLGSQIFVNYALRTTAATYRCSIRSWQQGLGKEARGGLSALLPVYLV